jgi:hypothetical protein
MTAPEIIHQLVKRFDEHREAYRSGKYNETQLRREFLDPLFEALGWDVFNRQGYAQKVKHEIESTNWAIDCLVYELHGLMEEEIGIVEGG